MGKKDELHFLGVQTASGGSILVADTNLKKGSFKLLSVNADAVFETLVDSEGNDMMVAQGIGSNTCSAGSVITALGGRGISQVKLVSGSVWGIV